MHFVVNCNLFVINIAHWKLASPLSAILSPDFLQFFLCLFSYILLKLILNHQSLNLLRWFYDVFKSSNPHITFILAWGIKVIHFADGMQLEGPLELLAEIFLIKHLFLLFSIDGYLLDLAEGNFLHFAWVCFDWRSLHCDSCILKVNYVVPSQKCPLDLEKAG